MRTQWPYGVCAKRHCECLGVFTRDAALPENLLTRHSLARTQAATRVDVTDQLTYASVMEEINS